MSQFRKKPVVIEAVHYIGGGNVEPRGAVPDWLWDALASGVARYVNGDDPLLLKTLEGDLTVSPDDWIIRGIKGELYPCKPDIFAATYEPASRSEEPQEGLDLAPIKVRARWANFDSVKADYAALLAEIARLRSLSRTTPEGWRPMESAPKDGTTLLLSMIDYNIPTVDFGWHDGNHWRNYEDAALSPIGWKPMPEPMPLPALPVDGTRETP